MKCLINANEQGTERKAVECSLAKAFKPGDKTFRVRLPDGNVIKRKVGRDEVKG